MTRFSILTSNATYRAFALLLEHGEKHASVPFLTATPLRLVADSRLSDEELEAAINEGMRLALQGAQRGLAAKTSL
jgi:hypothetical protein